MRTTAATSVMLLLASIGLELVQGICCDDVIFGAPCMAPSATATCNCLRQWYSCATRECPSDNETVLTALQNCQAANCTDCATPIKPKFEIFSIWPERVPCDNAPFSIIHTPEATFTCVEEAKCKTEGTVRFVSQCVETKPPPPANLPVKLLSCKADHTVQYERGYTYFTKGPCAFPGIEGTTGMKIDCERKMYDPSCNDDCSQCSGDLRSFDNDKCAMLTTHGNADDRLFRIICPDPNAPPPPPDSSASASSTLSNLSQAMSTTSLSSTSVAIVGLFAFIVLCQ